MAEPTASAASSFASSEIYLNDLVDLQSFLDQLKQLVDECEAGAKNSDDFFLYQYTADDYLQVLRFKERQLAGVRQHLTRTQTDPTSAVIREMLDVVEPMCRNMIHTLSKLRGKKLPPSKLKPNLGLMGSSGKPAADAHLSRDDEIAAQLEQVSLGHHQTSTVPDTSAVSADIRKTDEDEEEDIARNLPTSAAAAGHILVANDNALIGSATVTATPVLLDPQPADNELLQQQRDDQTHDEDLTSFVVVQDERHLQMPVERPRQPASDDWISVCIPPNDGWKSLDEWRVSWKEDRRLQGTTTWTVDLQIPTSVAPTEDQASAATQEYLMATFDKYKSAKDNELMRDFMVKFESMDGIDRGAMSREFFYLTLEACISGTYKGSSLMIGDRGRLIPTRDDNVIDAFKCLGMTIAHAARHGCRGLPGLSPAVKFYLVRGQGMTSIEDDCPPVSIDDVFDEPLYNLLAKLESRLMLTEEENKDLIERMQNAGQHVHLTDQTRHLVIQKLLIDYIYCQRSREIEAIAEGMERFKLRSFLRENPSKENINFIFPSADDITVDPDMFMAAVITRGDDFDQSTLEFLQQFLRDLHAGKIENKGIPNLVQYISGSPYLPERVVISFNKSTKHPISHACFKEIELPTTHRQYDSFRDAMVYALLHGMAFTRD